MVQAFMPVEQIIEHNLGQLFGGAIIKVLTQSSPLPTSSLTSIPISFGTGLRHRSSTPLGVNRCHTRPSHMSYWCH